MEHPLLVAEVYQKVDVSFIRDVFILGYVRRYNMNKTCTKCLITKSDDEFYKTRYGKPAAECKSCVILRGKLNRIRRGEYKGTYGTSRFEKLLGQQINDWTVIGTEITSKKESSTEKYLSKTNKRSYSRVLCRCKCGIEKFVLCRQLENKKSLGCTNCHSIVGSNSKLFKGIGEISLTYLKIIRKNAYIRQIPIEVSAEYLWNLYLLQDKKCALTGLDIDFGKHSRKKTKIQTQTASLDRINSLKGYIEGNVQWVHKHVNMMKNKYDNDYFKYICNLVSSYGK